MPIMKIIEIASGNFRLAINTMQLNMIIGQSLSWPGTAIPKYYSGNLRHNIASEMRLAASSGEAVSMRRNRYLIAYVSLLPVMARVAAKCPYR